MKNPEKPQIHADRRRCRTTKGFYLRLSALSAVVLLVFLLFSSCGDNAHQTESISAKADHGEVHWGYVGEEGPEHWADLNPDFELCGSGVEQSPIDLTGAVEIEDAGWFSADDLPPRLPFKASIARALVDDFLARMAARD